MKLRAKFEGTTYVIEDVNDTTTVAQIKEKIGQVVNIDTFSLSLNQHDPLDVAADSSKTLKECGIVSGDTIYIILAPGYQRVESRTATAPKPISEESAISKEPSTSPSGSSDPNCPFGNLPNEIKIRIIRRLPLKEFRLLSETSKQFHELWNDDVVWKHVLKRDFGGEAIRAAELLNSDSRFKDTYMHRYIQQKEHERRESQILGLPDPPPFITEPFAYFYPPAAPQIPGMAGGAHDLNPLGHFPYGGRGYPAPPMPGYHPTIYPAPIPGGPYQPFQPRVRPLMPYDPDLGLVPRPPGRGPRPGNPYGGGPHFPGGGFI